MDDVSGFLCLQWEFCIVCAQEVYIKQSAYHRRKMCATPFPPVMTVY